MAVTAATSVYCALNGGHVRLAGILMFESLRPSAFPTPSGLVALVILVAGLMAMLLPLKGPEGRIFKVSILFFAFFPLSDLLQTANWLVRACFHMDTAPMAGQNELLVLLDST